MKLVDSTLDARAGLAMVVRPKGHSNDVKTRAVMPFEQAGDHVCDRMLVKVARKVCESDPLGLAALSCQRQPGRDGDLTGDEPSRAGEGTRRVDGQLQEGMRRHDRQPCRYAAVQLLLELANLVPIACHQLAADEL